MADAFPGLKEMGLVMIVWAASSLIFQDLVVRLDIALVQSLSRTRVPDDEIDRYRRRLGKVCWSFLAMGLAIFLAGVALQVARL